MQPLGMAATPASVANLTLAGFPESRIPEHCDPISPFLYYVTAIFGSCVPTPLAFTSTLLGTFSIVSWLFAQLPQIIKNYRLQSTSGLSIFFLVEWCMGDLSNLSGALLTHQATWQIIIGGYYCFVDLMLVAQWIWYEKLRHGRPLRSMWIIKTTNYWQGGQGGRDDDMSEIQVDVRRSSTPQEQRSVNGEDQTTAATSIPMGKTLSTRNTFRDPVYGASPASVPNEAASSLSKSRAQGGFRRYARDNLPSPSPRTVLFVSMLLALCSHGVSASPMAPSPMAFGFLSSHISRKATSQQSIRGGRPSFPDLLGTVLSWSSTTLYLLSRMPQLLKNYRLRSTSGLSPLLFIAAFCGNLFYSSSMLFNPRAWNDFEPYGERGWVDEEGSDRLGWVLNALPFFLGAAGVLVMDAAVGLQFWLYAANEQKEAVKERVFVVRENESSGAGPHWRRVSGWMRGWQPGVGGSPISPAGSRDVRVDGHNDDRQRLLQGTRDGGVYGTYGDE